MENVLVAGANGTTGRIIINLLKESDRYKPIAMVRKTEQKEAFEKDQVSSVLADLEDDLSPALKNIDKVIFAAGSKGKNVIGVDQEGAKKLTEAAQAAGVEKLVMLSTMGANDPSISSELEDYLKAKQNADEHLKASGLNYSIVRPGSLNNEEGNGKIQLAKSLGKHGQISRADVAKTIVAALDENRMKNQTFEILAGDTPIEEATLS